MAKLKAHRLEDVYRCFEPKPLIDSDSFDAYYVPELDQARGGHTIDRFILELAQSFDNIPFKALLMGHIGNGKSTELTRLTRELQGAYIVVRIYNDIDPGSFKAFDVLAAIIFSLAEQSACPVEDGGLDYKIPDKLIQRIVDWFSAVGVKKTETASIAVSADSALGLPTDSWWAKLIGLSAHIKGEMKYAADRKKETVEYRLQRLSSLIDLLNELIDDLRGFATGQKKDILLIVEEFDRAGMDPKPVEELFITYANIFQDLRVSFIFTIPVSLGYSELNARLPFTPAMLYDTPVFEADFRPHAAGRSALLKLLEERLDLHLIEDRQAERMIVASGGNLRDLFSLVRDAAATARLRKADLVSAADVDASLSMLKRTVRARLAQSSTDEITYEQREAMLVEVHKQQPGGKRKTLDPVLMSLLRSRSVQEFNGPGRYAVAPLVVAFLAEQGALNGPDATNGSVS